MNLFRAELLKLRTTSLWWIFAIILVPLWGIALAWNWFTVSLTFSEGGSNLADAGLGGPETLLSGIYTSGQYGGVLLVVLLSAILVTSEFFHLTATSTFLTTSRRERVVLAKMATAVTIALAVWLLTTLLNLAAAPLALSTVDEPSHLGEAFVWQAIGLNALAFVLWALLGVGAGVLIRSQIGATITLSVLYVVGTQILTLIFTVLSQTVWEPLMGLRVLFPTLASDLLITGPVLPDDPSRWVGGLILLAYAAVTAVLGTLITRRRDVS